MINRTSFDAIKAQQRQTQPLLTKVKKTVAVLDLDTLTVTLKGKKKAVTTFEDVFYHLITASIKPAPDVTVTDIHWDTTPQLKRGMYLDTSFSCTITGQREGQTISEVYDIPLDLKVITSKQDLVHSTYFEGTLQVRNANQSTLHQAHALLEKHTTVTKIVTHNERNVDFYVSDKRQLFNVAQRLAHDIGGTINNTATLHTKNRQTQKGVYRQTVCFTQHNVVVGDLALHEDNVYYVTHAGKTITLEHVRTRNKISLNNDHTLQHIPWQEATVISHHPLLILNNENQTQEVTVALDDISNQETVVLSAQANNIVIVKKKKKDNGNTTHM